MENIQSTGIILCGGKSKRMGQNKALLKLGKIPIIEHVISIMEKVCNEIIISTNSPDLDYLPFRKVKDKYEEIGPISGVYSALTESQSQDNLILSCDTPFITESLLNYIFSHSKGYDIVLPQINGHIQSMTGYFNKSVISYISSEIEKEHYKPIQMFKNLNLNIVQISTELDFFNESLFFNINSHEDYIEACRIYSTISS